MGIQVPFIALSAEAATNFAARSPAPGAGISGCANSIWDYLPPEANVTQVSKLYGAADARIRKVFSDISTSGAYTIFLSIDAVFAYTGGSQQVACLQSSFTVKFLFGNEL
jgi:hypothetical protein